MNPKPLRHVDLYSSAGRLEALYRELQDPGRHRRRLPSASPRRRHAAQQSRVPRRARTRGRERGHAALQLPRRRRERRQARRRRGRAVTTSPPPSNGRSASIPARSSSSAASRSAPGSRAASRASGPTSTPSSSSARRSTNTTSATSAHCEKPMLFIHGTQDEHGDVGEAREARAARPQRRDRDHHRRGPLLHQAARGGGGDDARAGREELLEV